MGCKELVTTEQLGTAHGGDGKCPFPQSIWDASVIQGRTLLQVFSEIEGYSQELSQRGSATLVALLLVKAENWGGGQISLHLFKNHHHCYFYLFICLQCMHAGSLFPNHGFSCAPCSGSTQSQPLIHQGSSCLCLLIQVPRRALSTAVAQNMNSYHQGRNS